MKQSLIRFSTSHPRQIFALTAVLCVVSLLLMLRVSVDTDPENMLPHDHPARVIHDEIKQRFNLSDMIVVGLVNNDHANGVYNPQTLQNLKTLSDEIATIDGVVADDLMSLATSDNITQTDTNTISFHWMMNPAPTDQAQADLIQGWVDRLPMIQNTLVSGDHKVAGIYIPITAKDQSYQIYQQLQEQIALLPDNGDDYYVTGLPVAEDTFGVEMFTQMAISAPAAAALIFALMLWFFRSAVLVAAPMIVAMATVIITMGLMIGLGFPVHIMSSMIPIFLMPIAVVDAVHMLSDFSDHYRSGVDKVRLISDGVRRLFRPMLFTSITSLVGFVSLNTANIPPVRVFGSFVGIGIAVAFLLTITFIPAYIASLSDQRLNKMAERAQKSDESGSLLAHFLRTLSAPIIRHSRLILIVMVVSLGISAWGISRIVINDNPINWFESSHPIRQADKVLNEHFAGTYEAFLSFKASDQDQNALVKAVNMPLAAVSQPVRERWQELLTEHTDEGKLDVCALNNALVDEAFMSETDQQADWEALSAAVGQYTDQQKTFLQPNQLAYLEQVQQALIDSGYVGKASSVVDLLKTVNRELISGEEQDYRLPESAAAGAQAVLTLQSSHKPNDVWHMVTPDYQSAVIWLQLTSGDNQDMSKVIDYMDMWFAEHPVPQGIERQWSGLTYINMVWQDAMVSGMLSSLAASFVIVALMMIFLFRSFTWGLIAMIPLTVTITFIYGLIGLIGKNYDMPVAVLSALTLGMSVDFAIHFIERSKLVSDPKNWRQGLREVYEEPGRAISRNAIVIALGFTPLLLAPLVPYQTVGIFMASIMIISCVTTLVVLPALVYQLRGWLFKNEGESHVSN
ncbi:efflux RND transporter permease subunit [Suttonella sp. R2A3]|uniref:efflux RND transporter permease subunit n=1 Tax=Suttonella sp. R2A3 TaxID=2908648 RepID=UPI001F3D7521|nr:efflux RND transporter permease subunit [Suttonella sp. R2A3]UJF23873.1 efflux RND transporter permease subunit [Suttonella sp. R2A3]